MRLHRFTLVFLLVLSCAGVSTAATTQGDSVRVFTNDNPLVYEDAWDLWPYAFLNDVGEPVGYNIDLLTLMFKELGIPYKIKLKPTKDALDDLKAGRADLMCGMDAHFHNEYAQYGKSVIQIFTHSVVHHKDDPVLINTMNDLAHHRVIVHDGSFSHHLMIRHGWGNNAIPYDDMQEAVQYVHNKRGSQIVWNTLSLKWLLHKFQYDELTLTPVNIPHGEYKFMSNNPRLLEQLDSIYTLLNAKGSLQPIQNKWFYPERTETGIPSWVWYVVAVLSVIIVSFLIYYFSFRIYERRMTKSVRLSNSRLSVILQTSKVHIWLFDVAKKTVSFVNQDGKKTNMPLSPVLLDNYLVPEDYERLCTLLKAIVSQKEEHATLEVHTTRGADGALSIFSIDLSVMRRNRNGKPSVIIGATTDVTANRRRQQEEKDAMLRYQHIFNSAMVDTVSYNEHGLIDDMNQKAIKALPGGLQRITDAKISVQDVLGDPNINVDNLEYTYLTQIYKSSDDPRALNKILKRDELYYELQLIPVRDDDGHLLAIYGTGRDVTEIAKTYSLLQKNIIQLQEATNEQSRYIRNIDYVMKNGGVRMVNYSPDTHTLVIYSEINHVQYQLTQTRLLSLTADESKRSTQRLLNTMDNRTRQPVKISIKSTLRVKNSTPLCLYFSFVPIISADGHVTEYFGMCRDISDIKATEQLLERETQKAQEVETLKNAFLRNMSYEIRIPLTSVVGFAELFEMEHTDEDERYFIQEINTNSEKLLKLINNILFLSRLDAHMIEFKKQPVDLASIFENRCQAAWADYQQPGVNYIVDNPYERLVVDIDFQNLGIVIEQIVINAAQHTTSGIVRARFDYNGEDLTVTVNDTGCGIPADKLDTIFGRFVTNNSGGSSGLGLAICQEIIGQMGGRIHLNSEVGKGTTVWVNIPCSCQEIQRKLHQPV